MWGRACPRARAGHFIGRIGRGPSVWEQGYLGARVRNRCNPTPTHVLGHSSTPCTISATACHGRTTPHGDLSYEWGSNLGSSREQARRADPFLSSESCPASAVSTDAAGRLLGASLGVGAASTLMSGSRAWRVGAGCCHGRRPGRCTHARFSARVVVFGPRAFGPLWL